MSSQSLDTILTRFVLDAGFREQLRRDPQALLDQYDLRPEEWAGLLRLRQGASAALAELAPPAGPPPEAGAHYGIQLTLDSPFAETRARVIAALGQEGFGVLTEIDVQATLKQKLGVDFRPYVILGVCNPPLAYRAFQQELEIGLLMPCNVIVYASDDGHTGVSLADPLAMLGVARNPGLRELADEVRIRLSRVAAVLALAG